jgi:hypothetical protein
MENLFINPLPMPTLERLEQTESEHSDHTDKNDWSNDVEFQLKAIEQNAIQQASISKMNYLYLVHIQRYFAIPKIVLSSMISVFSIGLNNFISQSAVSILTCILGFIVATLGSIELYLGITKKVDIALSSYQHYYLLSIKINNCLRLERDHRNELNGRSFLTACLAEYEQVFQQNNITNDFYEDRLTSLELQIKK